MRIFQAALIAIAASVLAPTVMAKERPPATKAPVENKEPERKQEKFICNIVGAKSLKLDPGLLSRPDSEKWVDQIVNASGLKRNFKTYTAPINNAVALIFEEERLIVYDPELFEAIEKKSKSSWIGVSILAHEIGHHLNGHTILSGGSRPDLELEADLFSGFVLEKLGASVDDARAAMKTLASTDDSDTHPGKKRRLAAITAGWNKACATQEDCVPEPDDDDSDDPDVSPIFGTDDGSK